MVVVVIISILAGMAIANYIRMKRHAMLASCISNQRNICEAATIYASDHTVPDGQMGIEDLAAEMGVARGLADCPSDEDGSEDDYTLTWLNGLPRDVDCDILGDEHFWQPH
jgi:competence protein ComGC